MIQLGSTTAASATDPAFRKKILGSAMTTPIISNEEMINITKKLDNFKNLVYGKIVFAKELEM